MPTLLSHEIIPSLSAVPEGRPRLASSPPRRGHPADDTRPAVISTPNPTPEAEAASIHRTHRTGPRRQIEPAPWGRSRAEAFGGSSGEGMLLASPVQPQVDRACSQGHRSAASRPPAAAVSRRSRAGGIWQRSRSKVGNSAAAQRWRGQFRPQRKYRKKPVPRAIKARWRLLT